MSGMTDRDTFAAAALTGLCSMPPMSGPDKPHDFAAMAYAYADAMLRERCRGGGDCLGQDNAPNHDAAPAARAGTPGTGDTRESLSGSLPADLGDGVSPSENDKNLHHTQEIAAYRRFVGEVMNWISEATGFLHDDVLRTDDARDIITDACSKCWNAFDRIAYPTDHGASPEARAGVGRPRTDKADLPTRAGTGDKPVAENATTATLTGAEREAVYRASQYLSQNDVFEGMAEDAAALRGLLERLP